VLPKISVTRPDHQQAQAPGREHRVDHPAVQMADHDALDDQADDADDERREHQHREPDVEPGPVAEDRRVAADHHELAVREVDDPHHPEHHREPGAGQREERDHVEDLEEDDGGVVHSCRVQLAQWVNPRKSALLRTSPGRSSVAKPWAGGWQCFTAAVDATRRLPCAARHAVASRNSLRSLRSLRSNSRDESDNEARAARAPTARLRCSAPQRRAASHRPRLCGEPVVPHTHGLADSFSCRGYARSRWSTPGESTVVQRRGAGGRQASRLCGAEQRRTRGRRVRSTRFVI
jgi:hypothetical protein